MSLDKRRGNLTAHHRKNGANSTPKRRKSNKGYYRLAFVEPFTGVTERDIELRNDYALDAIARYYGVQRQMLHLRKKEENQSYLSVDYVYYVRLGKEPVGKVSIRVKRFGSQSTLTIIYQEKNIINPNREKRSAYGNKGYGKNRNKSKNKRKYGKKDRRTY